MLPDPSASRAVLIGTSRYTGFLDDLPAVAANLDGLARALCSPDLWGLPARNCRSVLNPATPAEMIDPIVQAAEEATDTLLVYYAGHGLLAARRSDFHLALTGSDPARSSYTAVPYELIRDEMIETRAERQIVVLDCCYSGRALGRMGAADPATIVVDEASTEGTYVIAAAAENKAALAVPGEPHTAFTAELLQVLREGVTDCGPFLDLDTIYRRVHRSMSAKGRPVPQRRIRNTADRLILARNRAHSRVRAEQEPTGAIAHTKQDAVTRDQPPTPAYEARSREGSQPPAAGGYRREPIPKFGTVRKERGYDPAQVDRFIRETVLPGLKVDKAVEFHLVEGGYSRWYVDRYLKERGYVATWWVDRSKRAGT
ncbi:caspase family protein [Actinoallomurus purpureus]|uniref:caspase family protein n=1 Tax=Actinoallomurus purpureus TaxID=478114 RepID=UPI002093B0D7|nr:caspase family protein [Actinoallomurus purpureus]MCO6004483.1 caspase family protein [Actinoallomurus purpureus]